MTEPSFYCAQCQSEYRPAVSERTSGRCPLDGRPLIRLAPGARPGAVINGRYRLDEPIGSGGMGVVFAARDLLDERDVALKIIEVAATEPDVVRRLMREARASAEIDHPNIVTVFDRGETEDGLAFLAMELLVGIPTDAMLEERGPLHPRKVAWFGAQVASALAASHARGILHRDLKPSNIFLARRETEAQVKVLDFGLAKAVSDHDGTVVLTITGSGAMLGTPAYMSPEQYLGEELTPQSDLYALGCVIYELAAGEPPFTALSLYELMHAHIKLEPTPLAEVDADQEYPDTLLAVIDELLEKEPDDRPASAAQIAERLASVATAMAGNDSRLEIPAIRIGESRSTDNPVVSDQTMLSSTEHIARPATGVASPLSGYLRPPLTGRTSELAALSDAWDSALQSGATRIALVAGPAGIGKSALVNELAARAHRQRARVVDSSWGARIGALGEVVDVLEGLYGLRRLDAEAAADRLQMQDASAVIDLLRPRGDEPIPMRRLRAALERSQSRVPALALLSHRAGARTLNPEHWAEAVSLLGAHPAIRTIVVQVTVDEERDGSEALETLHLAARHVDPEALLIRVGPLPEHTTRELIDAALLRSLPVVNERIAELAQGHPLVALHLARFFLDEGLLVENDGVHSLRDTWIAAPEALWEARRAQLQRHAPAAARIVARLVGIGGCAPLSLLHLLLKTEGLDEGMDDALAHLAADGWLTGESAWDGDVVTLDSSLLGSGFPPLAKATHQAVGSAMASFERGQGPIWAAGRASHAYAAERTSEAIDLLVGGARVAPVELAQQLWRQAALFLWESGGDHPAAELIAANSGA